MSYLKIAFRSILRHKNKLVAIALLVFLGTVLLIVGQSVIDSTRKMSRDAIIKNFTGHFIIYSEKSKDKPSPFSFAAPLRAIENMEEVVEFLKKQDDIKTWVPFAQNMGMITRSDAEDIPLIFNAIEPEEYSSVFKNYDMIDGTFFEIPGVILTKRNAEHPGSFGPEQENEGALADSSENDEDVTPYKVGDEIMIIGFTGSGSVNSIKVKIVGIYETKYFPQITSMINLMDIETYRRLFNFEGVDRETLPENLQKSFEAETVEDIFALGEEDFISEQDLQNVKMKKKKEEQEALLQ